MSRERLWPEWPEPWPEPEPRSCAGYQGPFPRRGPNRGARGLRQPRLAPHSLASLRRRHSLRQIRRHMRRLGTALAQPRPPMSDSLSLNSPSFPEFNPEREERLAAAAEILLNGMRLMSAERNREKTRKWRAKKSEETAQLALEKLAKQSVHAVPEDAISRLSECRAEALAAGE
jgi:hypothetical protein